MFVSSCPPLQSSTELSRRAAQRYAELEAVRQSRQRQQPVRPRSLRGRLTRLVQAFG